MQLTLSMPGQYAWALVSNAS